MDQNCAQRDYRPYTLHRENERRRAFLPTFPSIFVDSPTTPLLLANVSGMTISRFDHDITYFLCFFYVLVNELSSSEVARRQYGTYTVDPMEYHCNNDPLRDCPLFQEDAEELAQRLQVDMPIITFNACHFRRIIHYFLGLYKTFRLLTLCKVDVIWKKPILNSKEMAMALEFFLQFDGLLLLLGTAM